MASSVAARRIVGAPPGNKRNSSGVWDVSSTALMDGNGWHRTKDGVVSPRFSLDGYVRPRECSAAPLPESGGAGGALHQRDCQERLGRTGALVLMPAASDAEPQSSLVLTALHSRRGFFAPTSNLYASQPRGISSRQPRIPRRFPAVVPPTGTPPLPSNTTPHPACRRPGTSVTCRASAPFPP